MIGNIASKKLGLVEGKVDKKKWYQSKAIWAAVITALLGGIQGVSQALGHPITVPNWVIDILIGLGLYGLRTADKPIA
jgi:hypothetical protein